MDEDEGEDTDFFSCIITVIVIFVLFLLFRNQINTILVWLFNSVQDIIQ